MFESLKKKLSGTVGKISDKFAEEEIPEDGIEEKVEAKSEASRTTESSVTGSEVPSEESSLLNEEKTSTEEKSAESEEKTPKKSGLMGFLRGKSSSEEKDETVSESTESQVSSETDTSKFDSTSSETHDKVTEETEDKSGILSFVSHKTISEKDIDDILFELEMALLEGDVALEVAETIVNSVKENLVGRKIRRRNDVADFTKEALKTAISEILDVESQDINELLGKSRETGEPLKLMFVGINGTGKTTTIAKIATHFIEKGYTPVIAAADTFRAGAIEQITHHADKIGVKIIKHQKGADPAAVAFDAVAHARAKGKEMVLVDTAGRMQTNTNLMDEMKKIKRVIKPDMIIFVGDALTGNDAVEQARKFDEAVGVNGIILTKADADAKGGAALSIGYVIHKPILFLGLGQSYGDIMEFKPEWMVEQIFGE
ncbi:signal recognition particle-docking protein FtsY [Methanobacterium aggregans]|uniref:signal recognition particle-docking protein FtsY n=1 Tax=Methanobacterium aggregans TaxID=1615586 RepID=UPI001AE5B998|nr:signal recognition particle-docking protein FtsY [Methanobacterium aggregans]MBP2046505.1 fused signal recognition particle receptor [Methanobacterium aggregans]